MLRAVLDSNVIVSGVISSKGAPSSLLTAWRERQWVLVICPARLSEVQRVLSLPKITKAYGLTSDDIRGVIRLLKSRALVVPGNVTIARTARDPEDDHVLACAVEGYADYVVSGDQDLLSLDRFRSIPIVSPAAFAAILKASR